MLNIIKSKKINDTDLGEQGWLNEVYRYEKFDIGQQYNMVAFIAQQEIVDFTSLNITTNIYRHIENSTVVQFAGPGKTYLKYNCYGPILTICKKWKNYREKLLREETRI